MRARTVAAARPRFRVSRGKSGEFGAAFAILLGKSE